MLKGKLLIAACLISLPLISNAWPGFRDEVVIHVQNESVSPEIRYFGSTGGVYSTSQFCSNQECMFNIKDGSSGEAGSVNIRIGDADGGNCEFTVFDGPWSAMIRTNFHCSDEDIHVSSVNKVADNRYEITIS